MDFKTPWFILSFSPLSEQSANTHIISLNIYSAGQLSIPIIIEENMNFPYYVLHHLSTQHHNFQTKYIFHSNTAV